MMDHFGDKTSAPTRERQDVLNALCEVAPNTLLRSMQQYDFHCSFHIEKKGEFTQTQWLNRSEGNPNLSVSGSVTAREIIEGRKWSALFKNGILFNEEVSFAENTPETSGFVAIVFRSTSDQKQVLIGNWAPNVVSFNEVTLTGTEVVLNFGGAREVIQHRSEKWTSLWITWRSEKARTHWYWQIGSLSGHFTSKSTYRVEDRLAVGGRQNSTLHFHGEVLSLDIYKREDTNLRIPNKLIKLICAI